MAIEAYLTLVSIPGFSELPEIDNPHIVLDALPRVNDELSYSVKGRSPGDPGGTVVAVVQGIRWNREATNLGVGADFYIPSIILGRSRR